MSEATTAAVIREGDGILILTQEDARKQWYIRDLNNQAADVLGYTVDELKNMPLDTVLGRRTADSLREMVEFEPGAPDLQDVSSKLREFRLKHRLGDEFVSPVRLSRINSHDSNAWFQLVLPNERDQRAQQQMRDFLKLNLEGRLVIDQSTGLPDRATAKTFHDLLNNYLSSNKSEAAFAVLRLDRHDKSIERYGKDACVVLLKHAANCCRTAFRADDVICALDDHTLGLFLLDLPRESSRVVLNRLRWLIRSHRIDFGGKPDFSVTVSIAFDMLNHDGVLESCEASVAKLDQDERNHLIELGA
jgi:GGDEF domain-containing protein